MDFFLVVVGLELAIAAHSADAGPQQKSTTTTSSVLLPAPLTRARHNDARMLIAHFLSSCYQTDRIAHLLIFSPGH
jgi:hypothetical protein